MLPFTPDVFFSLFGTYNIAIWPAQIGAYLLAIFIALAAIRPAPWSGRVISLLLACFWLWNGVVYHALYFTTINFLAPVFAAIFAVQALLVTWTGLIRGRIAFAFRPDTASWAGLGLILFALVLYPFLSWLAGHEWPRMPAFGVAPCPTNIFTLGVLLIAVPRVPWHLSVIPLAWSAIGGSAAWFLGVFEDLSLIAAALAFIFLAVMKNHGQASRTVLKD